MTSVRLLVALMEKEFVLVTIGLFACVLLSKLWNVVVLTIDDCFISPASIEDVLIKISSFLVSIVVLADFTFVLGVDVSILNDEFEIVDSISFVNDGVKIFITIGIDVIDEASIVVSEPFIVSFTSLAVDVLFKVDISFNDLVVDV